MSDIAAAVQGTTPLVSVIFCTYNQREYVAQAIESVLTQTHPRIELIAIDNGSIDGTRDVLATYADDPRVRLMIHEENRFITQRLNEGIDASSGEFISLLYGDDFYLPEKTARQVELFRRLPAEVGVVHGPGYRSNVVTGQRWLEPSASVEGYVLEALLAGYHARFVNPVAPLVRRSCFAHYRFDERVFSSGEFHFLFIALSYRFAYLAEPLVVMREHGENLGKAYERNVTTGAVLFEALAHDPQFPARLRGLLNRTRAADARNLAWKFARLANDGAAARRYLVRAIRQDPGQIRHPRTLAGLCLSLLPRPVLRRLNRLADRTRGHRAAPGFHGI